MRAMDRASAHTSPERTSREETSRGKVAFLTTYLLLGTLFGIVLVKSEVVSWYRIQEMFRFQGFHMYGIFITAIATAMLGVALIKFFGSTSLSGDPILFTPKEKRPPRYVYGGLLFGLGWGLTGLCPGPIAAVIGGGYTAIAVVLASAVAGTWVYGVVRDRLPH